MSQNEPAFPVINCPGAPEDYPGLTKRELFAAMAMQGLCSSVGDAPRDAGGWISRAAMRATWLADALLAELAKEQP